MECMKPILFSGSMVSAILAGRKTQTRRAVKPPPKWVYADRIPVKTEDADPKGEIRCPYGRPGDRLWVRETWASVPVTAYRCSDGVEQTVNPKDPDMAAVYAAGWDRSRPGRWRPSIHMPRWASRITLEINGVRVERLQQISPSDAAAEGLSFDSARMDQWHVDGQCAAGDAVHCYAKLWEQINGSGSWAANPWVWVIEFKRVGP